MRKIGYWLVIATVFLGLTGCSKVTPSYSGQSQALPAKVVTASPLLPDVTMCEKLLKTAADNLATAKQQAKRAHVYTDWSSANKAMKLATSAYDQKDYQICISQAQLVVTYVERNQRYVQWRNSLNL